MNEEIKMLLPKDLLEDLEKGDRTKEFMTVDVDLHQILNDRIRDSWNGINTIGTAMSDLSQQQYLSQGQAGANAFGIQNQLGGWGR